MNRLIENTVFSGLTAACRRASWPTRRSPDLVKATTEGVVRPPSAFGITTGSPTSMTATTEFVVPRSMPMTLSAIAPLRIEKGEAAEIGRGNDRKRRQVQGPFSAPNWQRKRAQG